MSIIARQERAVLALYDYLTRTGVTKLQVMANMKKDGFTPKEISEAARKISRS